MQTVLKLYMTPQYQYLIKTLLLLLPFYISAEIIRRKPVNDDSYEFSDCKPENSSFLTLVGYFLIFMIFAIHIANKILEVDILSIQFGLLLILMCAVCLSYTILDWHRE